MKYIKAQEQLTDHKYKIQSNGSEEIQLRKRNQAKLRMRELRKKKTLKRCKEKEETKQ